MKPVVPCQDCVDRHMMCHEHCLRYQDYKSQKAELRRLMLESHTFDSYFRDSVRKAKRRSDRR